jgi:5-methylcytosine-specific restriction endonuclease McrA
MKRTFSKRHKRYLATLSGCECVKCGVPIVEGFHGDHVVAFSKGGKTLLSNGQALCASCNIKKGSKDD